MKHDKKHKKNKSPKRSKKSKKTDRKEKKQKHKEKKKSSKKLEKALKSSKGAPAKIFASQSSIESSKKDDDYCGPPIDLMNKAKCPTTKAEHDHRQSQIKRVIDPETGRIRLIKGDGEILEEIVGKNRHKQINQEATRNDGSTFQKNTIGTIRK